MTPPGNAGSGAAVVPQQTADMIFDNIIQVAPMLNEIMLLRIAGNLRFTVQGTRNAATVHVENAPMAAAADTLVRVSLTGYEFMKVISISATVKTMSIDVFESWIAKTLAEDIGLVIDNEIINGGSVTGNIAAAQAWANGVNQIIEVKIGYDGIVFASRIDAGDFKLKPEHVFLAQAAQVPQNGQMVANPYTNWNQIDKSLPNQSILLAIPGSNHGTREVYEENVVLTGCKTFAEVKALPSGEQNNFCLAMRTDGRVVEIAGDYTETLARLQAQKDAVGVFGLSFYESNRDRIKVATVNDIVPTIDNIIAGKYPVSRPLFFYVKGEHIGVIPGLQQFAEYFVSEAASGFGSPLEAAGLIPLDDKERAEILGNIRAKKTL
jgi:phosphate transport system substrate-binding protein